MGNNSNNRFYVLNGALYDAGVRINEVELRGYLERQWKAMEDNKKIGPIGDRFNLLLAPEYQQAHELYKTIRPDLYRK